MGIVRIILVDGGGAASQALAALIDSQPDLAVVGRAGGAAEALRLARRLAPDAVLVDVGAEWGALAARRIRAALPDVRVLAVASRDGDDALLEAARAGAHGFLIRGGDAGAVGQGIRGVLAGEPVVPPRLAAQLLAELARLSRAAGEARGLTEREIGVLRRIAAGESDRQIADGLAISINTVKSHVRGILGKLRARSRREAAALAARAGLLDG